MPYYEAIIISGFKNTNEQKLEDIMYYICKEQK